MDEKLFQNVANGYYIFQSMPDNVSDNWDRYICTNGVDCSEVESNYEPKPDEMVFFGSIKAGDFNVVLYKRGNVAPEKK